MNLAEGVADVNGWITDRLKDDLGDYIQLGGSDCMPLGELTVPIGDVEFEVRSVDYSRAFQQTYI